MKLLKNIFTILLTLSAFSCAKTDQSARSAQTKEPDSHTRYVNPFIGTAPLTDPKVIGYTPPKNWRVWAGLVYPGSSLPNAMVQLSPMTEYGSGAGYEYEDTVIYSFTHTNKGHWNLCNIPVLPISGKAGAGDEHGSRFSHETETASPGFYEVFLEDYKVKASLTSTLRCGFHKYDYTDGKDRQILFDLSKANNTVRDWVLSRRAVQLCKDTKTWEETKSIFMQR